jgi:hypothetical protein
MPGAPPGKDCVVIVSGLACTVSVVLPVIPFSVAEMVVLPGLAPKVRPILLIAAAFVFDEAQLVCPVRLSVLPSE